MVCCMCLFDLSGLSERQLLTCLMELVCLESRVAEENTCTMQDEFGRHFRSEAQPTVLLTSGDCQD